MSDCVDCSSIIKASLLDDISKSVTASFLRVQICDVFNNVALSLNSTDKSSLKYQGMYGTSHTYDYRRIILGTSYLFTSLWYLWYLEVTGYT